MKQSKNRASRRILPLLVATMIAACTGKLGGHSSTGKEITVSGPSCAECKIELVQMAAIREPDGEAAFTTRTSLYNAGAAGGWMLATSNGLFRLDASGKILGKIARTGRGPGEFGDVMGLLPARGDSMYLVDQGLSAMQVFSKSFQFGRRFTAPVNGLGWAALPDGRLLLSVQGRNGSDLFSMVAPDGKLIRIVHASNEAGGAAVAGQVELASASDGTIWAILQGHYLVFQFDSAGNELRHFHGDTPWFPHGDPLVSPSRAQDPSIFGLQVDSAGLIWVLAVGPDSSTKTKASGEAEKKHTMSGKSYFDCVVDVIDPQTGRIVASRRFDEFFPAGFIGPMQTFALVEDDAGNRTAVVWRLQLSGYRRPH